VEMSFEIKECGFIPAEVGGVHGYTGSFLVGWPTFTKSSVHHSTVGFIEAFKEVSTFSNIKLEKIE